MVISYSLKTALCIGLCILSAILFLIHRQKERFFCMIAVVLSSIGMIILKDPLNMSIPNILIPMTFSMASNIVYGLCFYNACKKKKYKYFSQYFNVGAFLSVACILLLISLMIVFSSDFSLIIPAVLFFLCLGFNVSSQFSYGYNEDGTRFLLVGASLMLLLADFLKFLPALEIARISENLATILYSLAHLLIIIFNSEFK